MKQLRQAGLDPAFWSAEDIENKEKGIDMLDFILDNFYPEVEIGYLDGIALARATYEKTYGREQARKN